ncbi:MAG: hypothetical protein JO093_09650 [Acidobacteria bacterium]|nr:hypothetical protein [Acidobacteriota bacterium]
MLKTKELPILEAAQPLRREHETMRDLPQLTLMVLTTKPIIRPPPVFRQMTLPTIPERYLHKDPQCATFKT